MKKKSVSVFLALVICLSFTLFTGCKDSGDPVSGEEASLTLDTTSATLEIYDTLQLLPTLTGSTETIVFVSSAPDVAGVTAGGLVTAVSEGTAIITASAGKVSANCVVGVSDSGYAHLLVVSDATLDMLVDDTFVLDAHIEYNGKKVELNGNFEWTVENASDVLTVTPAADTSKATVTALKTGTADITVKTVVKGETVYGHVSVSVSPKSSFTLGWGSGVDRVGNEYTVNDLYAVQLTDGDTVYSNVFDLAAQLIVKAGDETVSDYTVAYSSMNESVATIDGNGTITARASGKTVVSAAVTRDDQQKTISVNVEVGLAQIGVESTYSISLFDDAAYKTDAVFQFKSSENLIYRNSEYDETLKKVELNGKTVFSGSETIEKGVDASVNIDLAGGGFLSDIVYGDASLVFETSVARWEYPAKVYTQILTTKEDVQNWLNVAVGLKALTGTIGGYFILGNNITAGEAWTYTSQVAGDGGTAYQQNQTGNALFTLDGTKGFEGIFDGNGYYIEKMRIVDSQNNFSGIGFIPAIKRGGIVQNVAFKDCEIQYQVGSPTSTAYENGRTGFICSYNGGMIRDVYADVTLKTTLSSVTVYFFGVLAWSTPDEAAAGFERCVTQMKREGTGIVFPYTDVNFPDGYYAATFYDNANKNNLTVRDVFSVNTAVISNGISGEASRYERWAGFGNATAMAATADKYQFGTRFAGDIWTTDEYGLPYFKSFGATPYTY